MKIKFILGIIATSALAPIAFVSFLPTSNSKEQKTNIEIKANYSINRQFINVQDRSLLNGMVSPQNSVSFTTETRNYNFQDQSLRIFMARVENRRRINQISHPYSSLGDRLEAIYLNSYSGN